MGLPVYEVSKDFVFSASHQIRMHGGKCERLHGHNWRVRVHLRSNRLNRLGMVMDFADLYRIGAELCARFDHRNMNEVAPFDEVNPTAENVARFFHTEMGRQIEHGPSLETDRVRVARVEVWENDHSLAIYYEE
jgi:6-pyruvoyltetrahydropterin/6-carboxytetrahydropterin synthase